jgi:hypothetical protein
MQVMPEKLKTHQKLIWIKCMKRSVIAEKKSKKIPEDIRVYIHIYVYSIYVYMFPYFVTFFLLRF